MNTVNIQLKSHCQEFYTVVYHNLDSGKKYKIINVAHLSLIIFYNDIG